MAGTRTSEPPRSTAYYYADLERLKRKSPEENELGEYVDTNEVINDIPAREIPPFRDRDTPTYRERDTPSTRGDIPTYHERDTPSTRGDIPTYHDRDTLSYRERDTGDIPKYRDRDTPSIHGDNPTYHERDTLSIRENIPTYHERDTLSYRERDTPSIRGENISKYRDRDTISTRGDIATYRDRDTPSIREISYRGENPPFRDRQWSLPEYNTPENSRKGETYSTAGTFPMPEQKEKEPLLAELEVVGKMPLSSLESGVRRSRSWYLCCPDVGEEEVSRDSEWRYSSLHPVTRPPMPRNQLSLVATQSSGREDLTALRLERDSLARALSSERARAASAARAHDARLAELHGVIAELVRRRAMDKHAGAIPEEDVSDECESTTQPAGELENDADRSRTEQNESSSMLSPCELPTPQEKAAPLPEDNTDSSCDVQIRLEKPIVEVPAASDDVSVHLSERESHVCLSTRCCEAGLEAGASSCEREHGSSEHRVYTASPGRCESRQAKIASRVKLKRTEDADCTNHVANEEAWCSEAAERLALDVCAQADLREALVAANNDGEAMSATLSAWKLRCSRLQADCAVLQCALARAADTQHRLYCACSVQESVCVRVCLALRAADRALEAYDVLLALAETEHGRGTAEREAAELIASQLLARLDAEPASLGSPLLSPGPWLQHDNASSGEGWEREREARLRAHAARLKAETVSLRPASSPLLFSYHDIEEEDIPKTSASCSMADMEAAVLMQEVLAAKEAIATAHANSFHTSKQTNIQTNEHTQKEEYKDTSHFKEHKGESTRSRRRARERHWLETQASETDL